MSDALYANLGWLPKAPLDFRFRCRSITQAESNLGNDLRALASYCLDSNQLDHLAKIIEHARQTGRTLQPLIPFRLGLLSNSTVDFLVPALTATAARHGVALEVVSCGYDQAVQEALSPDSSINRAKTRPVLVTLEPSGTFCCQFRCGRSSGEGLNSAGPGSARDHSLGYKEQLPGNLHSADYPTLARDLVWQSRRSSVKFA